MEYILAVCVAVLFLIVLVLIRNVRENSASLREAESRFSDSAPEGRASQAQPVAAAKDCVPAEVVAAISAAVYCLYPGSRVRSLRRAEARPRSAWRAAGIFENTRPF